jgi:site-specific recombinase XerD
MVPIKRKDGRFEVVIPRKASPTGKRQSKYFRSRTQADKFIRDWKAEHREHGRRAVTSEERNWLGYWRERVGSLELMPTIVNFWKKSGEHLKPIVTREAIAEFIRLAEADLRNRRTLSDISSRLGVFGNQFGDRLLHEVPASDVEAFLGQYTGWNRWGYLKRLRPLYKVALRRRWVPTNPIEGLAYRAPEPRRDIYSVEDFEKLLRTSEKEEHRDLRSFIALAGFCFFRTSELVRKYKDESVLTWEDVLWQEEIIHVRPEVGKTGERDIPISPAAMRWLTDYGYDEGDCVPLHEAKFTEAWIKLTNAAGVKRIVNGLRHSAISYSLAANPGQGVVLTASWAGNSEATIRKHYRRLIRKSEGARWFEIEPR